MTIAFDATSEFTGTANPTTGTHTPVGTPKGVVVFLSHGTVSTDIVSGVTYGGVTMTRVATAFDASGDPGRAYAYFLPTGILTGARTVSVARTEATTVIHGAAVSATALTDTELVDSATLQDNQTDPAVTLQYGGRTCLGLAGLYSAVNAPASAVVFTGMTALHDHDFGAFSSLVARQTTPSSSDTTLGWTCPVNSTALIGLALSESEDVLPTNPVNSGGGSAAPRSPSFLRSALQAAKNVVDLVRVLSVELPRWAQAVACYERVAVLPYGATVRPSGRFTRAQLVTVSTTAAWTMANPSEPREGVEITLDIWNESGGTMGTITWENKYQLSGPFTNPADTKHRLISFIRMPDTVWRESRRTDADSL